MTTPTPRADANERADRAWAARVAGGTWKQAAEMAGYADAPTACRAVHRHYGTLPRQEREDLRNLWRDRLEAMWRQVQRDMAEQRPGSVTAAVRVAGAAIALDGLAEPSRMDVTVSETFTTLVAELTAHDL